MKTWNLGAWQILPKFSQKLAIQLKLQWFICVASQKLTNYSKWNRCLCAVVCHLRLKLLELYDLDFWSTVSRARIFKPGSQQLVKYRIWPFSTPRKPMKMLVKSQPVIYWHPIQVGLFPGIETNSTGTYQFRASHRQTWSLPLTWIWCYLEWRPKLW